MQTIMKPDISSREDIEQLVNTFYDKVKGDEIIGYIFHNIIGDDWSHHLPIMYQFWETILLSKPGYSGNPVKKHIELDKKERLEAGHFERWLQLWHAAVDELYAGETAEEAKNRGNLMAHLIKMKVDWARLGKSIE